MPSLINQKISLYLNLWTQVYWKKKPQLLPVLTFLIYTLYIKTSEQISVEQELFISFAVACSHNFHLTIATFHRSISFQLIYW